MNDPAYAGFDTETTGVDTQNDAIAQIAVVQGGGSDHALESCEYVKPWKLMPVEASLVNGLTNEFLADKPTFESVAAGFLGMVEGRIIVGVNVRRFDVPLARAELERVGYFGWTPPHVLDVQDFCGYYERNQSKKLGEVATRLGIHVTKAHDALNDVRTSLAVLGALQRKGMIPHDMFEACQVGQRLGSFLDAEFERWKWYLYIRADGIPRIGFGKYQGKPLGQTDRDYLALMLRKARSEMPAEVVRAFEDALARRSLSWLEPAGIFI